MADHVEPAQAHAVLAWTATIARWMFYPVRILFWYLALAVVFVFKLLYWPVAFVLQPFIYLGSFILACFAVPVNVAIRLETIYIYLGVAAIVGVSAGLLIRVMYVTLRKILGLDVGLSPKVRTAREYREEKRKQKIKEEIDVPLLSTIQSPRPLSPASHGLSDGTLNGRRQRGALAQTIMEDDDSEY